MSRCTSAYCPNAAGHDGRCDECAAGRRGVLTRGVLVRGTTTVKNNTGKPITLEPFEAGDRLQDHETND